jgi:hypothetical protein
MKSSQFRFRLKAGLRTFFSSLLGQNARMRGLLAADSETAMNRSATRAPPAVARCASTDSKSP